MPDAKAVVPRSQRATIVYIAPSIRQAYDTVRDSIMLRIREIRHHRVIYDHIYNDIPIIHEGRSDVPEHPLFQYRDVGIEPPIPASYFMKGSAKMTDIN